MKTLQFIYNKQTIDFSSNGEHDLMVNATQMAKAFGKETENFLKTDHAKKFRIELEEYLENKFILRPNGGRIIQKAVENRGRNGVFFERRLALKFATWLDVKFEFWVFDTIDSIILGTYKDHQEATIRKLDAIQKAEEKKQELMNDSKFAEYFQLLDEIKNEGKNQASAIKAKTKQLAIVFEEENKPVGN